MLVAALALMGILAGCSAGAEYSTADEPAAADYDEGVAGGDSGEVSGGDGEEGSGAPEADRAVVITGDMYMTVDDPIAAADAAVRLVKAAGGRIDGRAETAPDDYDGGSANLVLRIPSNKLDDVLDDLRELGTVDELRTDSVDVTNRVTDLESRISTLRASTLRIEGLLADATSISDIITLENELTTRQAQLESLEAQQRGLDDQVSLSTIHLSLTTEPVESVVEDNSPKSFLDGLEAGWNGLTAFVSWFLVAFGLLLPWLIVFALIALVIVWIVRSSRKRATRQASPAPMEAVEPAPPAKAPAKK
jgi:hypothetical protein